MYSDTLCSGCKRNEAETGEEMLSCDSFGENPEKLRYRWVYVVTDQVSVRKVMWKKIGSAPSAQCLLELKF
jgi:hypothetical protein